MRIGALDQLVTLQQPVETANAYGERAVSWQTFGTRWASIETLSGREREAARQASLDLTHRITLWWFADLQASWRIVLGDRVFNIVSIAQRGRRQWWELECTEQH